MDRPPPLTRFDWLWLAAFAGLSSAACLLAADRVGATFDEPLYLSHGRQCWHEMSCGWLAVHGTMPLPVDVQTALPVLRERLGGPPAGDVLASLRLARAGNLVFWWALLAYALLLGRDLGGPWAGRLAVGLLAADPTWQAHAALATTDVAAAATLLAVVYHALAARRHGRALRVIGPGCAFGVAILAKLSGLLYGGLALAVVDLWVRAADGIVAPRPFLGTLAARLVVGVGLAALYCGVDRDPGRGAKLIGQLGDEVPPAVRAWVAANPDRVPNALVAATVQGVVNARPGGGYLFGEWRDAGFWYYFPAVAAMKVPEGVAVAFAVVLVGRPRALVNLPLLLAVLLFAVTTPTPRQIGVRLVLPPLALAVVGLAVALARWKAGVRVGIGALAATAAAATLVWPNGLAFMNQFWGGPGRAYHMMADSNVDWGQGLPELTRWHDAHGRPPLALWYFGTDPRANGPRFRRVDLAADGIRTGDELKAKLGPTLLAVGHSVPRLYPDDPPAKLVAARWLAAREPVAKTTTFLIYDLAAE